MNVCVMNWHPAQTVFHLHAQCSQDRIWIHCNTDKDKEQLHIKHTTFLLISPVCCRQIHNLHKTQWMEMPLWVLAEFLRKLSVSFHFELIDGERETQLTDDTSHRDQSWK